jgi:hypothetical protein
LVGIFNKQYVAEDTLPSMLLRSKKVSFDEIQKIIETQKHGLKPFEEVTIESGIISLKDLQDVLRMQAMKTICNVFALSSADFRFEPVIPDSPDFNAFPPIPIETILFDVAKFLDEWPTIQKKLPDYGQVLSLSPQGKSLLEHIGTSSELSDEAIPALLDFSHIPSEEEIILQYFLQPKSISNAIKISKFNELDSCRCISSLLDKKLIENYYEKADSESPFIQQIETIRQKQEESPTSPSPIFWPIAAIFCLGAIFFHAADAVKIHNILHHHPGLPKLEKSANQQTHERASFVSILINAQLDQPADELPEEPAAGSGIDPGIYKQMAGEAKKVLFDNEFFSKVGAPQKP